MRPSNERRRYIVISSLIGWAHTQNDPWILSQVCQLSLTYCEVRISYRLLLFLSDILAQHYRSHGYRCIYIYIYIYICIYIWEQWIINVTKHHITYHTCISYITSHIASYHITIYASMCLTRLSPLLYWCIYIWDLGMDNNYMQSMMRCNN